MKNILTILLAICIVACSPAYAGQDNCNFQWSDSYQKHKDQYTGRNGGLLSAFFAAKKIVSPNVNPKSIQDWLIAYDSKICVSGMRGNAHEVSVFGNGILKVPAQFTKTQQDKVYVFTQNVTVDLRQQSYVDSRGYTMIDITNTYKMIDKVQ